MIKISLITPTRNRPDDLKRFLKSVKDTTTNPGDIEILFYVDDDDHVTIPLINSLQSLYSSLNVYFHIGPRSDHFSKDYYNFLSLKAKGRWVMAINDDSIFMTPGWDITICEKMEAGAKANGDDILLGIVKDGMIREGEEARRPTMSCWLLSSKEYVNLMNGLLLEEIYTWGGDYWLGRVFTKVQGGRRKIYILDVFIDHNSHHTNDRTGRNLPQPESFALFQRIERENPCTFTEATVKEKLSIINSYLNSK